MEPQSPFSLIRKGTWRNLRWIKSSVQSQYTRLATAGHTATQGKQRGNFPYSTPPAFPLCALLIYGCPHNNPGKKPAFCYGKSFFNFQTLVTIIQYRLKMTLKHKIIECFFFSFAVKRLESFIACYVIKSDVALGLLTRGRVSGLLSWISSSSFFPMNLCSQRPAISFPWHHRFVRRPHKFFFWRKDNTFQTL